ncbi:MAG: MATE family efflux transporter [Firmicutes bacterium]|nr:MATE family efflux transporter [Bacillota bacterium]
MPENKMGVMPIGKLIFNMSWPAILSMLMQAMYNVVDSFFVSRLGEDALAAVTYVFPFQFLMISVAVGTGVGINSLISRRLGAKRFEEANMAASHGYRLSFISWIPFLIIGLFLSKPMMHIMSDTPYIVENGTIYLSIVMIGSLMVIVQCTTEKILQATGNMIVPMICGLVGGISNIIMDPLLIFGLGPFPEMDVLGAAVATVFGQALSFVLGTYILFRRKHPVKVYFRGWKWNGQIVKDIYAVGGPAILMQGLGSILQFSMNMILGNFTETAVAVMGIYGRLQSFIFMPCIGLNQGVLPIMGYNYGAQNRKRFMEAFKKGFFAAFCIMLCGFILFQIFPHQLISVFNAKDSADMYEIGVPAFRAISWCFMPASFGIMSSSIFQASGHGFLSLWGSIIRQFVGVLPIALLFAHLFGLGMVWYSFPLAEIFGTLYFALMLHHMYKKEFRRLGIAPDEPF